MGGSKKVHSKEITQSKKVVQIENPNAYYHMHPTWNFNTVDREKWAFTKDNIGDAIWTEILPYLMELERQTWQIILIANKKKNHSINVKDLNKCARSRLNELHIEEESLISLHLNGTHRIYGYMNNFIFNILWYDVDHGDNETCVCRSKKKHT